jgi:hypothetical protein
MAQLELPPMAPGGQWIRLSGDGPPAYVVHEAHIKRLIMEGGQFVADPRDPAQFQQAVPQASPVEDALRAEIEALKVQMQQLLAVPQDSIGAFNPADEDAAVIDRADTSKSTGKRSKA